MEEVVADVGEDAVGTEVVGRVLNNSAIEERRRRSVGGVATEGSDRSVMLSMERT